MKYADLLNAEEQIAQAYKIIKSVSVPQNEEHLHRQHYRAEFACGSFLSDIRNEIQNQQADQRQERKTRTTPKLRIR